MQANYSDTKFSALVITETSDGVFERSVRERTVEELPPGDVIIRVEYSSLNYKDALSASGNKGITRRYPHTPGIDAAGTIIQSEDPAWKAGEQVLVTGYDLGMNTDGGYGQFIRVPSAWVVRKPPSYSLQEVMAIGTAGFTAALALYKMEMMGQDPGQGPVVVTGATGGVGSLAVAILSVAGYEVVASTGKPAEAGYLHDLGAARIETREFANDLSGKALLRTQWAGAIDTVGGNTLATLLKGCQTEGNVASTGLVGSPSLNTTVYPFILNGVSLVGVGSAETPMARRLAVWNRLDKEWNIKNKLSGILAEISLVELKDRYIDEILAGKVRGRLVVKL